MALLAAAAGAEALSWPEQVRGCQPSSPRTSWAIRSNQHTSSSMGTGRRTGTGTGSGSSTVRSPPACRQRRRPGAGLACFRDHFTRLALDASASASQQNRRDKVAAAVCLIHGVSGAFWEGADSDSSDHFAANDAFNSARGGAHRKGDSSVLWNLIKEIEPLDVSLISKDASPDCMDAMKRTVSGTLGLLPSDQFQITIESYPTPLARLLVSSMMTGYTLRNAEYRLSLQRSLNMPDEYIPHSSEAVEQGVCSLQNGEPSSIGNALSNERAEFSPHDDASDVDHGDVLRVEGVSMADQLVGGVTPQVANYIQQLQAKLAASEKELSDCKQALSALEAERMAVEGQNDLLGYLRSLEPDKVAELSQPTSPDIEVVVGQVVNEVLGTLSSKPPTVPPSASGGSRRIPSSWEKDGEVVGNVPLHTQAIVTVTRDYVARLLFWCMLLGHHMRGLEYRLELSRTLSLCGDIQLGTEEVAD